jgi:hypothetical protein
MISSLLPKAAGRDASWGQSSSMLAIPRHSLLWPGALRVKGVTLRVVKGNDVDPFWSKAFGTCGESSETFLDVTFVDDEAIAIVNRTTAGLDAMIDTILQELTDIFHRFHLTINWAKGKSEAVLRYRGAGASSAWNARSDGEGRPTIKLHASSSQSSMHDDKSYKH